MQLVDFGFTSIASLNYMETSAFGLRGSYRWTAPKLFNLIDAVDEGNSGLSTGESDVFTLGMVTVEIMNILGIFFHSFEMPPCITGQVPFPEYKTSMRVMKGIIDGEQPPRPTERKKLGLLDELWGIIQSSLAHRVEERPSVPKFVNFLKKVTPDIAMLEELTEFDTNSEEHIGKLHHMFEYRDNILLGM